MNISYEFKANLTTVVSTYLIPILIGYGLSETTSNAIVGLIVSAVIIGCGMFNEMYTSSHLSKEKECMCDDVDNAPVYSDGNDVPDFDEDYLIDSDLPEFESESVSLSKLE